MIAATSATVRNLTSLSGVASAAIDSPLPTELVRHARPGASVTPVSSVSPVWKRASPCEPCQFAAAAPDHQRGGRTSSYPQVSGIAGRWPPDTSATIPVLLRLANLSDIAALRQAAQGAS